MDAQFSVIVPCFQQLEKGPNLEKWLKSAPPDIEVILVVNPTDTESLSYLRKLKELSRISNLQIQIEEYSFSDPGSARNHGLSKATNDWVIFVDNDDLFHPDVLSCALQELNLAGKDAIIGPYEQVTLSSIQGEKKSQIFSKLDEVGLALRPGVWRWVFRRDSIECIDFPNLRMGEDQVFILDFLALSPNVEQTARIFYSYFIGTHGQLTSNHAAKRELISAFEMSLEKYPKSHSEKIAFLFLVKQILTLHKLEGWTIASLFNTWRRISLLKKRKPHKFYRSFFRAIHQFIKRSFKPN